MFGNTAVGRHTQLYMYARSVEYNKYQLYWLCTAAAFQAGAADDLEADTNIGSDNFYLTFQTLAAMQETCAQIHGVAAKALLEAHDVKRKTDSPHPQ